MKGVTIILEITRGGQWRQRYINKGLEAHCLDMIAFFSAYPVTNI